MALDIELRAHTNSAERNLNEVPLLVYTDDPVLRGHSDMY
ncbi:hypothetical protein M2128_000428 [Polynucleobacter sphagniphilus]|uniref:Uncharacterized protein n=1 Tax=Polynucleobacter sphagniphilus TaxID=1743169 RepID=A0AA43MCE2_9BURK|nr:hypothetical protein [Polynucleobacter sphagniphilus]MDH6155002.1 hypothetical protein [Polynucleobacter sphagniphilus]MDH6248974.1 hypothetical protein [Polynucleobacter sphagniphilus]MDH6301521.1 hypothetical protein [Polynucleobacter sphagniphilus]MDH6421349.1 hypothetical protein [Polynucleobacter sphagniphilus]